MLIVRVWLNTGILLCSSALHFYWAAKGSWKQGHTVGNANVFLSLASIGLFQWVISPKICCCAKGLIGTVFLAQAPGDGKYPGLFRKVKQTNFTKNDTWLYTPLSLIIFLN